MLLLCPHCGNTVERDRLDPREAITCTACGSSFSLDMTGSTTGYVPREDHRLGRFELLETLGQGGFGTVYKARDPQLDRTVAIKVPRAGRLTEADERERFLREARSVAALRHPSLVPVFEVGQEDGLPYLVSEFVSGVTLSDWLTARRPTPNEAAGLLATLAEALHYAHRQGVVHRDVKPANILIDEQGTPRLMDFGLAKREAAEATMTVAGQVLGTPAYMSPEQARGEAHQVDGRSDVYSLGVIFYQLLTGELPFRGNRRMLLYQVLNEEPRSPRSLNDQVPRDLATIVLKCLRKEPARRYETAESLAKDLRRYLACEPILARPVGRWERTWRWCRRQPAIAGLTAALVLVGVAGLVSVTCFWLLAESRRRQAVAEKTTAQIERDEADRQRLRADENLQRALQAVDTLLSEVGQVDLAEIPRMELARRRLLERALAFYQQLFVQDQEDASLRLHVAQAHERVASIHKLLGQFPQAEEHYRTALELVEAIVAIDPGSRSARILKDRVCTHYGTLLGRLGRPAESEKLLQEAHATSAQLFKEEPGNLVFARELARSYQNLGTIFEETGRFVEARDLLRTGVRVNEEVLAKAPDDREAERDLAATLHSFGILLHRTGEPAEAEKAWRRGIALLEKAVARSPDESSPRERLGMTYHSLGMVLEDARRLGEAETALVQALTHKRRLVKDFPNHFDYAKQLANTCNSLGILARKKGDSAEAELYFREALAMHERLQQDRPDSFDLSLALVGSYCNIGIALSDQAKVQDALPWLDKAADRLEKLRQANPRHPSTRQYTRNTHQARARVLCALGRFRDAVSDWDRAIEYDPGPFRSVYRVYRTLTLAHLGEFEQALPEARRLVNLKHVEAGAYFELACVFALAAATKTTDAEEHAQQAVALLMQARDGGYRYRPRFERDPDLDALRGRADFQQVLKGLAAR